MQIKDIGFVKKFRTVVLLKISNFNHNFQKVNANQYFLLYIQNNVYNLFGSYTIIVCYARDRRGKCLTAWSLVRTYFKVNKCE